MSDANKNNNAGIATLKKQISQFDKFKDKSKMGAERLKKFKSLNSRLQSMIKQKETGVTADPRITKEIKAKKGPIVKGPIVSKKELAASGLSLRDYLNKQQGKTRKHGDTLVKGTVASNYKTDGKKDRNMGVLNTSSDNKTTKDKNIKKIVTKKKTIPIPKKRPISQVDDFSKSKVKQGPPKGIAKKAPVKKKSKSNISGSSSYDADFTKKGLEKRGLSPKASMSKENLAKTTAAKDKNNASGQDFGGKKKKKTAPMYESKGTNGAVKNPFDIKLTNNLSKKKQKERLKPSGPVPKYKSMGGKLKMAKGYSAGGKIFTGR
jgi:hypothetical protein